VRQRLTREESQALTRTRLLEAGAEVFAEKGFYGASVEEIAERAGYTRGAFYSNFADKPELFLALIDQRTERSIDEISAILRDSSTPEAAFEGIRRRDAGRPPDRSWFLLTTEFRLYALRNAKVRPKLVARERQVRRAFARAVTAQLSVLGVPPPAPPEQMGLMVQALDDGLWMHHQLDPAGVPRDLLVDTLEFLLRASLALARDR
jgi:AcrR family transcriptional regulator